MGEMGYKRIPMAKSFPELKQDTSFQMEKNLLMSKTNF